ncbi:hypothetical protein NKI51_14855 [Mesorhizobium australicum]|uniref:hypothetical protein n=1 Tax=Mesorhizobium australicum TaxID=536018 RepID=UPI003336D823
MAFRDLAQTHNEAGSDVLAIPTVAAMIAVLFAGSTVLTPSISSTSSNSAFRRSP